MAFRTVGGGSGAGRPRPTTRGSSIEVAGITNCVDEGDCC
jgi:hypothetical protein